MPCWQETWLIALLVGQLAAYVIDSSIVMGVVSVCHGRCLCVMEGFRVCYGRLQRGRLQYGVEGFSVSSKVSKCVMEGRSVMEGVNACHGRFQGVMEGVSVCVMEDASVCVSWKVSECHGRCQCVCVMEGVSMSWKVSVCVCVSWKVSVCVCHGRCQYVMEGVSVCVCH